jgi:hypothetical protein
MLALAEALVATESKILYHLVKFSTCFDSDELLEVFTHAMPHNNHVDYLCTGRRQTQDELAL